MVHYWHAPCRQVLYGREGCSAGSPRVASCWRHGDCCCVGVVPLGPDAWRSGGRAVPHVCGAVVVGRCCPRLTCVCAGYARTREREERVCLGYMEEGPARCRHQQQASTAALVFRLYRRIEARWPPLMTCVLAWQAAWCYFGGNMPICGDCLCWAWVSHASGTGVVPCTVCCWPDLTLRSLRGGVL